MNIPGIPLARALVRSAAMLPLCAALLATTPRAMAATAPTTLSVTLTINAACLVSTTPVAFPAQGVLSAAVPQTGSVLVTCTNTTTYTIGLDKGAGTGASVTNRLMTGPGSATVQYGLFQDSGLATNWTDTGAGLVSSTGTGAQQTFTVYGNVPAQTTPAPGAYADTVNVTVTY